MIRSSRAAGFTLLELMVVVVIIGVLVGLAGPAIQHSFIEKRMNEAALDLVRGLRRARSEAMGYGRASLVRFDEGLNDGRGGYVYFRGISNSCNANDWVAITAGACAANPLCLETYDPERIEGGDDTRLTSPNVAPTLDVCFQPNGITFFRSGPADVFADRNTVNGAFVFTIQRVDGESVDRRVVLPLGGSPRVLR